MATIATTTVANPLQWPSTTLIDYSNHSGADTGYFALVRATTANTYEIWRTVNNGVSWTLYSSLVRANIAEVGSIYASSQGHISWCYRTNESSQDRIYYRRLDLHNATWSAEVLLSNNVNGGVAGSFWGGCDVITVDYGANGSYQAGMVIAAQTDNGGAWLLGFNTLPGGQPQLNHGVMAGPRQFFPVTAVSGHHSPSIDLEHAGGKTSNVPNLWVCYGRNQILLNKIAWNGHGWIVPTGMVAVNSVTTNRDYIPGRWDGQRFLMVRYGGGSTVTLYERNKANTSTTVRTTPAHPQGTVRSAGLGHNSQNFNTRVFAVGTSTNDLYYVDYTRATGIWGSWTLVSGTDITGANVDNYSIRRTTIPNAKYDVLTAHAGVDIVHQALGLTFAPQVPTWVFSNVPYVDGSAADVAASLLLDWQFNDPDPNDTQSAYALSRQVGSGALEWWRASDSTWQVAEVQNTSAVTEVTLTATQWSLDGAAGGATDPPHTFRVRTWDSTAVASNYSAGLVLIPSSKVNPTISTPVDSSTWVLDKLTVNWTVAEQSAYQAQITFVGFIIEDSGKVVSSATSHTFQRLMENNFNFGVRLTTWNAEGLKSDHDENAFSVRFVQPRTPTVVLEPQPTRGRIQVAVTNPGASTFVAAGAAAQGNNVTLNPALPGGGSTTGDLLVVASAIENSGTGTPNTPAGYTSLATFGNIGLFGKIRQAGEAAPSVSYTGGVAGAATSAQVAAFREAELAAIGSPFTQLNGSAQNIAYAGGTPPTPNCIMILFVWKQDGAATVFSTPAGFIKIGDIFNANGQSLSWYYQIQTTATAVPGGTVTVTSGVSAISRSLLVPISGVPNVLYNDIWRIRNFSFGDQIRVIKDVPVNGVGFDWRALSGQEYLYQAIAIGDNGSSTGGLFTL